MYYRSHMQELEKPHQFKFPKLYLTSSCQLVTKKTVIKFTREQRRTELVLDI